MIEELLGDLLVLQLRSPVVAAVVLATLRSTLLVLGAWAACRLGGARVSARDRRIVWSVVIAGLVAIGGLAVRNAIAVTFGGPRWVTPADTGAAVALAAALWGVPCAVLAARLLHGRLAVRRLVRDSRAVHDARWTQAAAAAASVVGLRRPPALRSSAALSSPIMTGIRQPTILLPRALPPDPSASPAAIDRAVLIHEMEHARAHDVLWRQASLIARALLWFSPATWLAAREARLASEQACDERALDAPITVVDYARHLARAAESSRVDASLAGAMAGLGHSELVSRLAALRERARRGAASTHPVAALLLAMAMVLGALALTLPRPRVTFIGPDESLARNAALEPSVPAAAYCVQVVRPTNSNSPIVIERSS